MKSNLVEEFIKKLNSDNDAFIIPKMFGIKHISKKELLSDIYKMNAYLKSIKEKEIVILSYPYSYYFYVAIFAGIFAGKSIVLIDSFNNKDKLKHMMEISNSKTVLVDSITKFLKYKFPKNINFHPISKFKKYKACRNVIEGANIITFTSGTTAMPKKIERDLSFLEMQMSFITNNITLDEYDIVYGLLPMYTLLSVFLGYSSVLTRNPKKAIKCNMSMLMLPIKSVFKIKKPMTCIKRAFLGGALLYEKEAMYINSLLPNASVEYVYGASEGAIIYKTFLKDYLNNPFTFKIPANGIDIEICNKDKNDVGEIAISGLTVLGDNNKHFTGDYGKLLNDGLKILGRKKYSNSSLEYYNYELDEIERKNNPNAISLFTFFYNDNIHVVYEGKITLANPKYKYHYFKKLPYDLKHKTKLDYGVAISLINNDK